MSGRATTAASLLVLIFVAGYFSTFVSIDSSTVVTYETQTVSCTSNLQVRLLPSATVLGRCDVMKNQWATLRLNAQRNITAMVFLEQGNSSAAALLFNSTSPSVKTDLYFPTNGTVVLAVRNSQSRANQVTSSLVVFAQNQTSVAIPTTVRPFATPGYLTVALSALLLIVLIFEPQAFGQLRRLLTRTRKSVD